MKRYVLPALLLAVLATAATTSTATTSAKDKAGPVKVAIKKTAVGYQLLRDGQPYVVKGAGAQVQDFESLAKYGGNSVRTWHVEEDIDKGLAMLDRAHQLGLTVSLCLNISRERHGFDYDDEVAIAAQFDRAKAAVVAYKDHPAVLSWMIGNELNYDYKNPAVYDAVNDIAKMIHQIDPNHPVTTTIAGYIRQANFDTPYFVTEWGAVGHWEVGKTAWGAPVESNSTEKAANYLRSYEQVLASDPHQALGNYVFLWGQKQERTATWYGLFMETGEATEVIDVMTLIWTGEWPANRSPRVESLQLIGQTAFDNIHLNPGQEYTAQSSLFDPDGDELTYTWSVKPESTSTAHGGDREDPIADLDGLINQPGGARVSFVAPASEGAYRIFMVASDGRGSAAHGNIPFYVRPSKRHQETKIEK
jgi:hypothetical protein